MISKADKLPLILSELQNRARYSTLISTIFGGIVFFVASYTLLINNPTFVDRIIFIFVGAVFGRMHGIDTKRNIDYQSTVVASLIELNDAQRSKNQVQIPVEEVKIPSQPKLPDIPSIGVPAEVNQVLKTAKGKGKLTKLPPKRKPKITPPAQA